MEGVNSSFGAADQELEQLGLTLVVPEIEDVLVIAVDDDPTSLTLVQALLERIGHPVLAFTSSTEALEAVRTEGPKILVTDLVMPDLTGLELAERAREFDPNLAVVLVTSYGNDNTISASEALGISGVLAKPLDAEKFRRAIQRAFLKRAADDHHREMIGWMYEAMSRNADRVREVTLGALASLINAADARSPHFRGHSQAVAMQAAAVGQALELGDDEVEAVRTAGLLHDVGMIGIPDAVVQKPGALTPAEYDMIRTHCEAAATIVGPMKHLGPSIRYVVEHHERWDGSGYPHGKIGSEISLGGQVVGIAEAWTGIIESRAYRDGRTREEGMALLLEHQGEWFSEPVTQALLASDVGVI